MKFILALCAALVIAAPAHAEVTTYLQRQAFEQAVVRKVHSREFAALDAEAKAWRKSKARMADGLWKLAVFYRGLATGFRDLVHDDASWTALENELVAYARQHRRSSSAWLIYSAALQARAWELRGRGFANTVTPEGWAGFRQHMEKARKVLDSNKRMFARHPEWYAQRIGVATYLSEGPDKASALFNEGAAVEPMYHDLYFSMLFQLMPRWGGSIDEMARFMNAAARQARSVEGVAIYARLAWSADGSGHAEVIDSPAIDWALMKKSFDDVLSAYPTDWNAQEFFFMACTKSDRAEAARLLGFIKEEPSPALLGNNVALFKTCMDWAAGKVPVFIMRDRSTGLEKVIQ